MQSRAVFACVLSVLVVLATAGPVVAAPGFEVGGSPAEEGSEPGQVSQPQRMAVRLSTGQLFVADRDNDRVQIFDTTTGAVVGQFGDATSIDGPHGIAVDQATGDVYVASVGSKTISKWSDSGLGYTRDALFTGPVPAVDPNAPVDGELASFISGLAVDPSSGDLLVAVTHGGLTDNPAVQRVLRFDSSGAFVGSFDGSSSAGGPFTYLKDIAVDATGDIWVIDAGRIERFNADYSHDATLAGVAGAGLIAVDPVSGDPVVVTDHDDRCSPDDRLNAYAAGVLESSSAVPQSITDCTYPHGLAFDAAGDLYVSTGDAFDSYPTSGISAIHRFERGVTLPTVAATAPTGVTETTARLHGSVDSQGAEVSYFFEYSTDGMNWTPTAEQGPVDNDGTVSVEADVGGLVDGTAYRVRLAVRKGSVIAYSSGQQFTTVDGDPPALGLDAATASTGSGFTLSGSVDPRGLETTYRFELSGDAGVNWTALAGPDGDVGVEDSAGSGSGAVPVTATAAGLEPNRDYLYRLVATNAIGQGQVDGSAPARTAGVQATVADETVSASQITATGARVSAELNPRNAATDYYVEYGPTGGYGSQTIETPLVSTLDVGGPADTPFDPDTPAKTVSRSLSGLAPNTTYHYRLVADNGNGPAAVSADRTFTTAPGAPIVGAVSVAGVTASSATLSGSVDTYGLGGTAAFTLASSGGGESRSVGPIALDPVVGPRQIAAPVAGLPAGFYTVRLTVTTAAGETSGELTSFATAPGSKPPPPKAEPPAPPDEGKAPSGALTARAKVNGTRAALVVAAPTAGVVTASGRHLGRVSKRSAGKGRVTLVVKLTKPGRRALRSSRNGRISVRVRIRFAPRTGDPQTVTRTLTFKRKTGR